MTSANDDIRSRLRPVRAGDQAHREVLARFMAEGRDIGYDGPDEIAFLDAVEARENELLADPSWKPADLPTDTRPG